MDEFKAILFLVLFYVSVSSTLPARKEDLGIGKCSLQEYANKSNICLKNFFLSFRYRQNVNCPDQFRRMKHCQVNVIRECYKNYESDGNPYLKFILNLVRRRYRDENIQEALCEFNFPIPTPMSRGGACKPEFRQKAEECAKDFIKIYRVNRGDPALCKTYQEAKKCTAKALKNYCDQQTIKRLSAVLEVLMSDKYNPFCTTEDRKVE